MGGFRKRDVFLIFLFYYCSEYVFLFLFPACFCIRQALGMDGCPGKCCPWPPRLGVSCGLLGGGELAIPCPAQAVGSMS